ncbi:MAG: 16S rRNA (guanine(527)-N(7))-methyltransferase RsmG, partial [Clostridia bacterium]|nr:16S rRNA (guanine(527)-N(7))-methyltransferase RsmG [Clostridia bacterium]
KGPDIEEEINNAKKAISILGGTITNVHTFDLPNSDIGRTVVEIEKSKSTDKRYPRKAGVPSKEPIV